MLCALIRITYALQAEDALITVGAVPIDDRGQPVMSVVMISLHVSCA